MASKRSETGKAKIDAAVFGPGNVPAATPIVDEAVYTVISGLPATMGSTDELRAFLTKSVSTALARRAIREQDLTPPPIEIVVPAIEALRYSPVRQAFTSLIATSMDARAAHTVLPAYVEILKQIGVDELALLKSFPELSRFMPIADIVYVLPSEQIVSAYRNVIAPGLSDTCVTRSNIPQYIDNLVRLNLIHRPLGQQAADVAYRPFARLPFVKALMKTAPPRAKAGMDKAVCGLTDLGHNFRLACID